MNLPEWDALETVEAIHSFLEHWALGFFAGVVVCDLSLHFLEGSEKLIWSIGWREHTLRISICGHFWTAKFPACSDTLELKRLIKKISLLGFAIAILLEIVALPYSERIGDLSRQELANAQKQTTASIEKSVEAIRKAGGIEKEAASLRKQAALANERAKQLELRAEQLHKENLELEASLSDRFF